MLSSCLQISERIVGNTDNSTRLPESSGLPMIRPVMSGDIDLSSSSNPMVFLAGWLEWAVGPGEF
jgi:hypothetical protein